MTEQINYTEEKKKYHEEASKVLKEASKDSINPNYLLTTSQYHDGMANGELE